MLRIVLVSILTLMLGPSAGWASMPSRADVRRKLERFVQEAREHPNTREWIKATTLFSPIDKEGLLAAPNLPEKMPIIKRRFNDEELVLSIAGSEADFQNILHEELRVNGGKILLHHRLDLPAALRLINPELGQKQNGLLPRWLNSSEAWASAIDTSCFTNRFEFMWRSPGALLESKFGYVGNLFMAGVVLSATDFISSITADCEGQIEDMLAILRENKIGIKHLDCNADGDPSDRHIEFWIPEKEAEGAYKTRTFNLDYYTWVAQDADKEEEEKEKDKEEKAKKKKKEAPPAAPAAMIPHYPSLFIFGTDELQEVRTRKVDEKGNQYYCESSLPGSESFDRFKKEIEPYRKIFAYIGNHNSCAACVSQMLLRLRTPKAPAYFELPKEEPKPLKPSSKKKGKGRANADDDEVAPKSAH